MAATIFGGQALYPCGARGKAGLRSFDRGMPEEVNRLVTDALSDYCFITSEAADGNLRREGVPEKRKYSLLVNVMIDTLFTSLMGRGFEVGYFP